MSVEINEDDMLIDMVAGTFDEYSLVAFAKHPDEFDQTIEKFLTGMRCRSSEVKEYTKLIKERLWKRVDVLKKMCPGLVELMQTKS